MGSPVGWGAGLLGRVAIRRVAGPDRRPIIPGSTLTLTERDPDVTTDTAPGRTLRVLAADEDEQALESTVAVLRELGHEVTALAVSVDEASRMIAREEPDLAVVVVHRDDDHALDLIEELAEYAPGPVIVLLGSEDQDFVRRAAERGIAAYAQPITAESVGSAIELAMHRHAEVTRLNQQVDQLETALERRALIERAKGILMERHSIGDREAFERLRAHARSRNLSVVEVARAVSDGHALLPKQPGGADERRD
jgi:AmiR/NasT family two-component response regulator